jgi:hypothetical protein
MDVERSCVALAVSVLQLLGPYNLLKCDKCGSKEKVRGYRLV